MLTSIRHVQTESFVLVSPLINFSLCCLSMFHPGLFWQAFIGSYKSIEAWLDLYNLWRIFDLLPISVESPQFYGRFWSGLKVTFPPTKSVFKEKKIYYGRKILLNVFFDSHGFQFFRILQEPLFFPFAYGVLLCSCVVILNRVGPLTSSFL